MPLFPVFTGRKLFHSSAKIQASAASQALNLDQIEQAFAQAIKAGDRTVTFTAPASYSTSQMQNALNNAAKSQNRLLAGSVRFRKQTNSASANAKYTFELSDDAFIKIKRLKSGNSGGQKQPQRR